MILSTDQARIANDFRLCDFDLMIDELQCEIGAYAGEQMETDRFNCLISEYHRLMAHYTAFASVR